jgi:hypothetical protein
MVSKGYWFFPEPNNFSFCWHLLSKVFRYFHHNLSWRPFWQLTFRLHIVFSKPTLNKLGSIFHYGLRLGKKLKIDTIWMSGIALIRMPFALIRVWKLRIFRTRIRIEILFSVNFIQTINNNNFFAEKRYIQLIYE